jgi:hypothetical protein
MKEFLIVKAGGTYNYVWALGGYELCFSTLFVFHIKPKGREFI